MTEELLTKQRIVATGIIGGIIGMALIIGGVYVALGPLANMEAHINRLSCALICLAFAAIPLFIGIALVGNGRFLSAAIDPLVGAESERMKIYIRFLANTLEQFVMFAVGLTVLSLYLSPGNMRALPALTLNFVVARILFLLGYLHNPLHRATGFAMTMYPTSVIFAFVFYEFATRGLPF